MAQHRGPKTITQDLVFHYDTGNEKSFAGEPTTNLVNAKWSAWGLDGSGQGSLGTRTILSDYHCRIVDVVSNTRQSIWVYNLSPNTTYTFSVKFKKISGTPTLRYQLQPYNGGSYITSYFPTTAQIGISDIEGWQTAKYTITTPANTDRVLWFMQDGDDYTTYTHTFELKDVQCEAKSHATPFVGLSPTNLIQNTNVSTWGMQAGVTVDTTSLVGPTGKQDVYKINFGSYSGGDAIGTSITSTIGNYYTFIGWVRADSNTSGYITIGRANSNPSVSQSMSITTQWQRFEVSYTQDTNTTLYHNFAGQNTSYYVAGLEIRNNQRLNTDALLDLSKRSVMTVANASFDSNAMLNFDGTNDYVQLTSFPQPTNYITCEAWINPQDAVTPGTIRGGVISSTNSMYLGIFDSADGGSTFGSHWAVQTSTGARPYNTNGQIPRNQWTHIVGTYNGSTSRMYINGVEIWNASLTGTIPSATYYIGTYGGTIVDDTHNFNGYISVAKIYNRALTAEQVLQNFNASRRRFGL